MDSPAQFSLTSVLELAQLRFNGISFFLAPTHEKLGQLYEARGDMENARSHYAAFVELWEGADDELQPRVAAARQRLLVP